MHFRKGDEGSGLQRGIQSPVLAPLLLGCWSLAPPLLAVYSPGAGDSHNSSSTEAFPEIRSGHTPIYRPSPLRGLVGTETKHDPK